MSLLKNAIKSQCLTRNLHPNQTLRSARYFSVEPEKQNLDSTVDSFIQTPTTGVVYGRLNGITNHTIKSDIVNLLEGCNLSLDDIKVEYNRSYAPMGMMIQFPSRSAYDAAIRTIVRKGGLYRLDRADRSQWDLIKPYDGKYVLLQGIPRNALPDDVDRFLSGSQYDASSMQMFARQGFPDPIRMALVRFPSSTLAMNACITKNRSFCLNNQVLARVLH